MKDLALCTIAKASYQTTVPICIYLFSFIVLWEFCTWFYWYWYRDAICHLVLLQNHFFVYVSCDIKIPVSPYLTSKPRKNFNKPKSVISNSCVIVPIIVTQKNKVIDIKSNKYHFTSTLLCVKCMPVGTLLVPVLFEICIDTSIPCSQCLLQPVKFFNFSTFFSSPIFMYPGGCSM